MLSPGFLDELDALAVRLGADVIMGPRTHHAYGRWLTLHRDDETMATLGHTISVRSIESGRVLIEAGFAVRVKVSTVPMAPGRASAAADLVTALLTGNVEEGVVLEGETSWSRVVWRGRTESRTWDLYGPLPGERVLWRRSLGIPRVGRTPLDDEVAS